MLVVVDMNLNIPVNTARASTGVCQLRIETVCGELLVIVTRIAADPKLDEGVGGIDSVTSIGTEDDGSDMMPRWSKFELLER